jgi:hypothetical protein
VRADRGEGRAWDETSGSRSARAGSPFGNDADEVATGTSLSLAVSLAEERDGRDAVAGGLLLSLPTDSWLAPSAPSSRLRAQAARQTDSAVDVAAHAPTKSAGTLAAAPSVAASGAARGSEPCTEEPGRAAGSDASARTATRPAAPRLDPRDARAAVQAALAVAGLESNGDALDDLSNRARWSAALPELRLRVTRLVDENASVSPTEYDADRQTASGGASLVLEARAAWQLDRALFADQELQIARLRQQLDEERRRIGRDVLALLFQWQRAVWTALDPNTAIDQCWAGWLRVEQLATELDVQTGGWFERWRGRRRARHPEPHCADD